MSALLQNYSRFNVEFVKGEGINLFDKNGKKYMDFFSGIAVTGFGHKHPEILRATREQLNKLWHVSNLFKASEQEKLAETLTEKSKLKSVFFSNSGTEANEAAIKFARKWGGKRKTIIATNGSFHGRTMGSLSITGQKKLWNGFTPMLLEVKFVEFDNIEQVKSAIDENVCAVMLEPIQGEKGVIIPSENYLVELRKICNENNLLLILDEVQSGTGRTGKFFAYQWEEITPDIITLAKGLANGLPLGAVICSEKVSEIIKPGDHGSTFGGNPVAVAAANKVVELLDSKQLENIYNIGTLLKKQIEDLNISLIKTVRGKGLMIGVELTENVAKEIVRKLLEKGTVVGNSGDNILRLLPPFIITENDVKEFMQIFKTVLDEFEN